MANPRIDVEIGAKIDKLKSALTDAEGSLQKFGSNAIKIGGALSLAVTLPLLAIGKAAVKTASDFEETASKFNTVFRDVQKSADDAFTSLRDSYGLSGLASKQLLSDTGDLLTGFGFSQKAALDLSLEVNKLAVDLASFTNFAGGAEGASQALTKALLGERESVKALGIAILEEDVKKQVAINTAKGLIFETERQAKAQATLDIAIKQSANAIGDYDKTKEGLANQTRLLQARIEDLSASFGEILLPITNKIVTGINGLVQGFLSLDKETRTTIVILSGIAAAIGPLLLTIGTAIKLIPVLIAGFAGLKTAVIAATAPFAAIGIAIALAIPLIIDLNKELARTKNIAGEVAADLLNKKIEETNKFLGDQIDKYRKLLPLLTEEERIKKVLAFELKELNKQTGLSKEAFKAQRDAILDFGIAALAALKDTKALAGGLGLIEGLTKQINDLKDARDLAGDQQEINLIDIKVKKLQEQLDLINAIAFKAANPIEPALDINPSLLIRENPFGDQPFNPKIESGKASTQGIIIPKLVPDDFIRSLDEIKSAFAAYSGEFLFAVQDFAFAIKDSITNGLGNAFVNIGDALGKALVQGTSVVAALGGALLDSIGAFLGDLGQQLIAFGIAGIAFGSLIEAIKKGGPLSIPAGIAAIAAGTVLVAISGAISNRAGQGLGGGGGGGGGGVGSSSGASSQSFGGSGLESPFLTGLDVGGTIEIDGTKLLVVLNNASKKRNRG